MICGPDDHNFLATVGATVIILTMIGAFFWLVGVFDDKDEDDDEPTQA